MIVPVRMSFPFGRIARTARPGRVFFDFASCASSTRTAPKSFFSRLYAGHYSPSREAVHAWYPQLLHWPALHWHTALHCGPRLLPARVCVPARPLAHVHALRTLLDHVFIGALADGARRLRVVGDVVVKDAVLRVLDALPRVVDAGAREGEELERGDVELRRCGEMLPSLLVLDGGDAAVRRKAPGVEAELPEFIEPILNERGLADYEDALESARPRPSRGRDGLPAALLVAEVAEQLHGEPGDVFSLKREQKRRRARDRRAVLRETRGNDRVEIGDIREIEGGGQKLDVRGVDFAERARGAIGHDLEREVAAIDGGD